MRSPLSSRLWVSGQTLRSSLSGLRIPSIAPNRYILTFLETHLILFIALESNLQVQQKGLHWRVHVKLDSLYCPANTRLRTRLHSSQRLLAARKGRIRHQNRHPAIGSSRACRVQFEHAFSHNKLGAGLPQRAWRVSTGRNGLQRNFLKGLKSLRANYVGVSARS